MPQAILPPSLILAFELVGGRCVDLMLALVLVFESYQSLLPEADLFLSHESVTPS